MTVYPMVLDPDADGTQWYYREMLICDQRTTVHPELSPYACYDPIHDDKLIGTASSKQSARTLVDDYLAGLEASHKLLTTLKNLA